MSLEAVDICADCEKKHRNPEQSEKSLQAIRATPSAHQSTTSAKAPILTRNSLAPDDSLVVSK